VTRRLRQLFMSMGGYCPPPAFATPTDTVVLTYHGVSLGRDGNGLCRDAFEDHVRFLKSQFSLVPLQPVDTPSRPEPAMRVALSFDDGFRNHAEVVAPILRRYQVPATFFVPTRHTTPGRYLWFAYLSMLSRFFPGNGFMFRGEFIDMSPGERRATMLRLEARLLAMTPHPSAMYEAIDEELPRLDDFMDRDHLDDRCAGMTLEQLEELASDSLFTLGAHTVDHPLLTRCTREEQLRQMSANKDWIERLSGRRCDALAYPGSAYNGDVLQQCREAGFTAGFSDHRTLDIDAGLEMQRTGVYFPSVAELGVKVRWSRVIARVRNGRRPKRAGTDPVSDVGSHHA
jgi:peptidoglycan/xylan/chitin deacetylase (PgdA/CDA1 family)